MRSSSPALGSTSGSSARTSLRRERNGASSSKMTDHQTSNIAQRYRLLESQRLRAQALGTISEGQLDTWLEKLDELWERMTPEERADANLRASRLIGRSLPLDLGLRDVAVEVGKSGLPRSAA